MGCSRPTDLAAAVTGDLGLKIFIHSSEETDRARDSLTFSYALSSFECLIQIPVSLQSNCLSWADGNPFSLAQGCDNVLFNP